MHVDLFYVEADFVVSFLDGSEEGVMPQTGWSTEHLLTDSVTHFDGYAEMTMQLVDLQLAAQPPPEILFGVV